MAKTAQKITLGSSSDIPFDKLVLSQSNVRRVRAGVSIEQLAEDIARGGLLQSLNVRQMFDGEGNETGTFEVPAGGRRYQALALLVQQKRLAKTASVPCVVRDPGTNVPAEDDSLAENIYSLPLHLPDQFRNFQALCKKGRSKAVAYSEDLISRARQIVNFPLTGAAAWKLAALVCDAYKALRKVVLERGPDVRGWLCRIDRKFFRTAGKTPLHSEVTKDFFASKERPLGYRRGLEQFREICSDKEVALYTADDCWTFRNWLSETKDEKKGRPLAGHTKSNKLSSVSSLFSFAIERRHRNDNPMRDVKYYPKSENRKKVRRLYTEDELIRLFVEGERPEDWQYWAPLLGIYAALRLREAMQLRPFDICNNFGVWHLIIRPGRGQRVKRQARLVPLHRELIRLGLVDLHKHAMKDGRDWLFANVPLTKKPGKAFSAPDVDWIMVPSTNEGTKWFARYCDECNVSDPNVDFHALRGAFITYGSQQGQDLSLRMEIAGHSKGSGVHQQYIYDGAPLTKLKAEIDAINYPINIPRRR